MTASSAKRSRSEGVYRKHLPPTLAYTFPKSSTKPCNTLSIKKIQPNQNKKHQATHMCNMKKPSTNDWLNAPKIVWPGQLYPQNLDQQVLKQRMENPGETTDLEAMIYISTFTLAGPPTHEIYNIYMHLFNKWLKWKGENPRNYKWLEEINELNPCEQEILNKLKASIRKSQEKQLKKNIGEKK
jgi:hypothetical protein